MLIREYTPSDLSEVIGVYKSAFAEPPWDEFQKCVDCGVNYGISETKQKPQNCKKCELPLRLTEFWSSDDIKGDLNFAFSQKSPIALVAEMEGELRGFAWGYQLPFEKFSFLEGKVGEGANYLDDVAVRADSRGRGIGKKLCEIYLSIVFGKGINSSESVLRTDRRNVASMGLFKAVGFREIGVEDPEFPSRVYLSKKR